jgi:hypothetical protein
LHDCVSTDAALGCLEEAGYLEKTLSLLRMRIEDTIQRHTAGRLEVRLVCFCGMGGNMREVFSI